MESSAKKANFSMHWLTGLCLAVLLGGPAAQAQEVNGHLEGRVLDAQGAPIAAVNVTLRGESLQGERGATTDERGYFRVPALPVGTYTVRLSHTAYQGVTYEKVDIRLGRTTSLGEVRLQVRTMELPEVVVSGERPLIDPTSTTLGANLTAGTYQSLPVERNFRSMTALLPQANLSFFGDEVNISGTTGIENAYFIDGINTTDIYRASTSTNLPYNFVQEIEVKTGGYEAEFGRALGGIVNVITPSGSNDFHGQVFGFFTDDPLTQKQRPGTVKETVEGFTFYDLGFSFHGPIARDQLWFYAAYNPIFERRDVEIPGLGIHKDSGIAHLLASKLTWKAGSNTSLVFTLLGDPSQRHKVSNPGLGLATPSRLENPDSFLEDFKEGGVALSLKASHRFSERLLLDASLSRFDRQRRSRGDTERGRKEPTVFDFENSVWSGGFPFFEDPRTGRTALQLSGSLFLKQHVLKAGLQYEDNFVNNRLDFGGGGIGWIFRNSATSYSTFYTEFSAKVHNRVPSVYVQDSWLVTDRLRLNAGLRWDGQYLIGSNEKIAQRIEDQHQPRIGFTYQPGRMGSQKISGAYGRFYEQLPLLLSAFNHFETRLQYSLSYDHNPALNPAGGDTVFSAQKEVQPEVKGLKGQHFDEFTLGYEQGFGKDYKASIRGIYRNLRWAIENGYILEGEGTVYGNPGRGNLSHIPKATHTYKALELTLEKSGGKRSGFMASYVLSRNHGNYPGLYQADLGFAVPNASEGYFDLPEQIPNSTGLLPNDRTHMFKFFGSYRFDLGLTAGASLLWATGTPLTEYGASRIGGEEPVYLRPRGSVGRTPSIWDLSLRFAYDLATPAGSAFRPRLILDLRHAFSQRKPVVLDQIHYTSLDEKGNQAGENPNYLKPKFRQPPMSAQLGVECSF